jgi:hypothetical protein
MGFPQEGKFSKWGKTYFLQRFSFVENLNKWVTWVQNISWKFGVKITVLYKEHHLKASLSLTL